MTKASPIRWNSITYKLLSQAVSGFKLPKNQQFSWIWSFLTIVFIFHSCQANSSNFTFSSKQINCLIHLHQENHWLINSSYLLLFSFYRNIEKVSSRYSYIIDNARGSYWIDLIPKCHLFSIYYSSSYGDGSNLCSFLSLWCFPQFIYLVDFYAGTECFPLKTLKAILFYLLQKETRLWNSLQR